MRRVRKSRSELAKLDANEWQAIILLAIVFTVALTFNQIYFAESASIEIFQSILVFVGMLIVVFMHEATHKIVLARYGYMSIIKAQPAGLLVSLAITIATFGAIPFAIPNAIITDARPDKRLTRTLKYYDQKENARLILGGIFGTTLAIVLFNTLYVLSGIQLFATILLGAVLHGVYSLIPWELLSLTQLRYRRTVKEVAPGDGVHLFRGSKFLHMGAMIFMVVFGLLALTANTIAYVLSLAVAVVGVAAYHLLLGSK